MGYYSRRLDRLPLKPTATSGLSGNTIAEYTNSTLIGISASALVLGLAVSYLIFSKK